MVPEQLEPRLELLREEYVLVQAWKKTAPYIRYHNWFSDTLALDRAAVNLPAFIGELRERLQSSESWQNDPLRIVPAPKSQRWRVRRRRVGARREGGDLGTASTARPRQPGRPGGGDGADALSRRPGRDAAGGPAAAGT